MNKLKKRKRLIRKLFRNIAKETVGPNNMDRVKLIISKKTEDIYSYCKPIASLYGEKYIIGLNLNAVEYDLKNGFITDYYRGRPERLNKYIINNRHNALRFSLYHELRHAYQWLSNKGEGPEDKIERDADTWALAHLKKSKVEEYPEENKKVFVGNCVNVLNDEQFREHIADDATLLAQLVENSKQISKKDFMKNCYTEITLKKFFEYFYNEDEGVYFYRDTKKDMEYFYI